MSLLLSNPVSRTRIVLEKAGAMVAYGALLGFVAFGSTLAGSVLGDLSMSVGNVAAVSLLLTLVCLVFGTVSLTLGAATGKSSLAIYGSAGLALVFYSINAFLPLEDSLADVARISPFYYYLTSDPLVRGIDLGHTAVLAGLCMALIAGSVVLFSRRDLR